MTRGGGGGGGEWGGVSFRYFTLSASSSLLSALTGFIISEEVMLSEETLPMTANDC